MIFLSMMKRMNSIHPVLEGHDRNLKTRRKFETQVILNMAGVRVSDCEIDYRVPLGIFHKTQSLNSERQTCATDRKLEE
jgi:hypothetical protein